MEGLKKYMYLFIESTFPFLFLKICFNVSIFFQKLLNLLKKKLRVSFKGNKKDATEFLEMKEIMGLKGNGVVCVYPREKNIKNMLSISKEKKKKHQRVSPVDGTVLRFGELKESRGMNEQVKGHSYSAPGKDESEKEVVADKIDKSWLKISLASPKLRESISARSFCCTPMKGLYYCVIYLRPGDYHRIHSPADWNALVRRHFAGRLFPVNECATRTIKNLYVVLEGIWKQGFMALDVDGATNIGSIEEQVYDPQGHGVKLEKGKEVGVFNMGSTVAVQTVPQITDSVLKAATQLHKRHGRLHNHLLLAPTRWMGLQKGWTLINQHHPALEMRRRASNAPGVIVGSTTICLSHQVFFSYITSSTQLLFSVVCVFPIFFLKFPATSSI
ncbi:hypothetical protein HID58_061147 [Brassica napus]|uniref:Phosphatidylserine decarboxylase n=1 Tax=Brassica napus TaxID=3708 RepID=A0ABQ7ZYN1_BRANA|nr:hypothetical protein HID58_061147 [Brassica napus]